MRRDQDKSDTQKIFFGARRWKDDRSRIDFILGGFVLNSSIKMGMYYNRSVLGEIRVPNGTKIARSPSLHRRSQSLKDELKNRQVFSESFSLSSFVVLNVAYWCYYLR
ncbi:hypothetical protein CEXT_185641 [Caerostris extrusa]|uniref:Uncharacterized protein n=1 Tax=Caerostris extrusa TaxID=172846 RepID=A0AAV4NCF1_CAEEX|nr:hypothetical protein CEXT_185641 [Caerostris extrusa]